MVNIILAIKQSLFLPCSIQPGCGNKIITLDTIFFKSLSENFMVQGKKRSMPKGIKDLRELTEFPEFQRPSWLYLDSSSGGGCG